jgi:hypothetical protein
MSMSKKGIFYDLSESTYTLRIDNITYCFSSITYMNKFNLRYLKHREELAQKLTARYGINLHFNVLSDILLYRTIEKRGCYLLDYKGDRICPESQILHGMLVIQRPLTRQ